MATKYTEKEIAALLEKEKDHAAVVVCPRCGKELTYEDFGSAYEVKCPTPGCLKNTVRGL